MCVTTPCRSCQDRCRADTQKSLTNQPGNEVRRPHDEVDFDRRPGDRVQRCIRERRSVWAPQERLLRSRAELLCSGRPDVRRSLRPGVRSRVRCSGSGLCSSRCPGMLRSGRAGLRCSVRSGLCGAGAVRRSVRSGLCRSFGLLRSRRSGVLRSGSFGLLRSFQQLRPRLRRRRGDVRLVQEALPQEPKLRTFVLLCSGSELLRSGSQLLRSGCGDLRRAVRCLQLM